jgi:hypothetical protein
MPDSKLECPIKGCDYNENVRVLDAAQERPLVLESTRSHAGEDAWRDMDYFDRDEELARLRRAIHEVRHLNPTGFERHQKWSIDPRQVSPGRLVELLAFIGEAFDNLDENLVRLGPLPEAWHGSSTVTRLRRGATKDTTPGESNESLLDEMLGQKDGSD